MNSYLHIHIDEFNISRVDNGCIVQIKGEIGHAFEKIKQISYFGDNVVQPWILYGFQTKSKVLTSYIITPQAPFSGFLSVCNFTTVDSLQLEITYENGNTEIASLLEVDLVANEISKLQQISTNSSEYRIVLTGDANEAETVIIMPTFQPDLGMLYEQVESILNQSYDNWHCLIIDDNSGGYYLESIVRLVGHDKRFTLIENRSNLGFYKNIEQGLTLLKERVVKHNCSYIALSDQDDVWYSEKLQKKVSYLKEHQEIKLVFCDQEILDENLILIQKSFWANRNMNITEIDKLMFKNCVTGAASVFDSHLLDQALPFPNTFGKMYHDQWLALVAAFVNGLDYVDESLYGYRQHVAQDTGFGDIAIDIAKQLENDFNRLKKITETPDSIAIDELSLEVLVSDILRLSVVARALKGKTELRKISGGNLELLEPFVLAQSQLLFDICAQESKKLLLDYKLTSTMGEETYFLASSLIANWGDGYWRSIEIER